MDAEDVFGPPVPSTADMLAGFDRFFRETSAQLQRETIEVMRAITPAMPVSTRDIVKVKHWGGLHFVVDDKSHNLFNPRRGYSLPWELALAALAADAKAKGWTLTLSKCLLSPKPFANGLVFNAARPLGESDVDDVDDGLLPSVRAMSLAFPILPPPEEPEPPAPAVIQLDPEEVLRRTRRAVEREVREVMVAYTVDGVCNTELVQARTDHDGIDGPGLRFVIGAADFRRELPWADVCAALQDEARAGGWQLLHNTNCLVFSAKHC